MKKEILNWFENDREFNSGAALYHKYGRNLSMKLMLNRIGNSPEMYRNLCYDLATIAGISEAEYKSILSKPIESPEPVVEEEDVSDVIIQELPKKKEEEQSVKRSFKLREQFPFLKHKDCPGILKELVADMLTDYENFTGKHEQLVNEADPNAISQLSQEVVEDYLNNRAIWKELKHFQDTGQLLGEHPIFEWMNRRSEIRAMKGPDLIKLRDQLNNKIPRTRKLITDDPEHKDTAKRQERIKQFEQELAEVKLCLGLDA